MLVIGLEDIEGRFSRSLVSRSELHSAGTLCRRNLRRDWAGDFVELEGPMQIAVPRGSKVPFCRRPLEL